MGINPKWSPNHEREKLESKRKIIAIYFPPVDGPNPRWPVTVVGFWDSAAGELSFLCAWAFRPPRRNEEKIAEVPRGQLNRNLSTEEVARNKYK